MLKIKILVFLAGLLVFQESVAQIVNLTSSNLPIVVINTNGVIIPDEPKINGRMGIIWNTSSGINNISDQFNNFDGDISIEIRGASSQMFPKKSYGFEIHDEAGLDMDASLLGMPEEEDWILYAPYSDKTLIRNVLTFTLDSQLGHYTPRCKFVELVINNNYQGVYVLMEKIKRDKNRVDIAKLKADDVEGEELTGGYIVKIDKFIGSGGDGFPSAYNNSTNSETFYQYEYPKSVEIQPAQKNYIYDYIYSFEKSVADKNFNSVTGYRAYIDVNSFVDYLLINELSKNVDGYRLSTFFYKDKNEKLNIGPVWDFNLAYGNANYYNGWLENGFQLGAGLDGDYWINPFWWDGLKKDSYFNNKVVDRWEALREYELSNERVFFVIDSLVNLISDARVRNYKKWDVINEWVWPNYYVGPTYDSEVVWLKNWISTRLQWLDANIPDYFNSEIIDLAFLQGKLVEVGPNPFNNWLVFYIKSGFKYPVLLNVYSPLGVLISSEIINLESGMNEYNYKRAANLGSGIYFYRVLKGEEILGSGKIVKTR